MTTTSSPESERMAKFARLMRLGHVSYAEGNYRQAHRFWRRAAMIHPADEQVWLALLNVLENNEDRRVCLQNIVAINPNNLQALRQLNAFVEDTQPSRPVFPPRTMSGGRLRHLLLRLLEATLIGALIAVGVITVRLMV